MRKEYRYVSANVSEDDYEDISEYCDKYDITKSALIRTAVFKYMETHDGILKEKSILSRLLSKIF